MGIAILDDPEQGFDADFEARLLAAFAAGRGVGRLARLAFPEPGGRWRIR
jgi:hypothetical protein